MRADVEGADRARKYHVLIGFPETSVFKTYVNNNFLLNCNISVDGIHIAGNVYEGSTSILQVQMRRKKPILHSKIEKCLYLFQYQRDTKSYIYTWTFLRKWCNIITQ